MADAKKPVYMHGARAVLSIAGKKVGIFTSCSYSYNLDVAPIPVLGRYGPAATEYTGAEPVRVSCSGWRVLDKGPFAKIGANGERIVPTLNELITAPEISIAVYDRETEQKVLDVVDCRTEGVQGGFSARSLSEISVSFIGLALTDESLKDGEGGESGVAEV